MKIEGLTVENTFGGAKITFFTRDYEEVQSVLDMHPKHGLKAKITAIRQKRSLDQNSYFWKLADEVGAKVGLSKEDIYRDIIQDVGVFDDVAVADNAVQTFVKNWHEKGTGWIAEVQPDCKVKGATKVRCYYGSSCYNTKQMSRLIDRLCDTARELGVETLPKEELERMERDAEQIRK